MKDNKLDGTGRQQCVFCSHRSIAGLIKGQGVCPFHWAKGNWGAEWAARCYPDHPEAKPFISKE